ncbi:MAG: hypothetical protein ABWY20_08990 [Mycobacterium sp.]
MAVAEGVGYQRWWGKGEVFVECGVSCAEQVDAELRSWSMMSFG